MSFLLKIVGFCLFVAAFCSAERLETLVILPGSPSGFYGPADPRIELTQPEEIHVSVKLGERKQHGKITVEQRKTENTQDDIDVMFVERLPRIDYDGPNGGWPTNGQHITWRAHVKNWGTGPPV